MSMAYLLSGNAMVFSTYRPVAPVLMDGIRTISSASTFFSFPQPAEQPMIMTIANSTDNTFFIFMLCSSLLKMEPV